MKLKVFIFFIILLSNIQIAAAQELTPKEIVKKSDDLMRGKTCQGIYTMKITTPRWERELSLRVFSQGRDKMFIRILSPAKEAGIGTLRIENEMWNYLPSVERTIKIPPSMMLQPWMGSDFANDDLVKESSIVVDYTHKIIETKMIDGNDVYVIEFTPKPDAAVIWGKLMMQIRKKDFVPLRQEYYDERGKLIKVLEYSDIAEVSGRTIPRTWAMISNTKENHCTVIHLKDVKYDEPIAENVFTLSNLKRVR